MKGRIIILDDDRLFCNLLKRQLEDVYEVVNFIDPEDAVAYFRENEVDVVLTDLNMPKMDGVEVLKTVKSESFNTDVIIMTAFATVDSAIEAMKKGAYDYIIKPFSSDEILLLLEKLFEKRELYEENLSLRSLVDTQFRPENIIGESEAMKDVYKFIERVAPVSSTVLLTGESGTGKELVAKAIHFSGERKNNKFVSINCAAIPDSLLEAELFGFMKGAFSGASQGKPGLFEYAKGGTIFLDEIADASLTIQGKLLKVLQEHRVRPLGGHHEIVVDIRVICATNKELRQLIKENRFREDLYYRINVVSKQLPPLRDRREDIPLLVKHFLGERKDIDPRALDMFIQHEWPGNVRELKNVIERLTVLSGTGTIRADDLPAEMLEAYIMVDDSGVPYTEAKRRIIDKFNVSIITQYLRKYNGNVGRAAEDLHLDRANLQRLMRKYNISARRFKERIAVSGQ